MSKVSTLAINAADHLVSKGRLDAAASILRNFLATNAPQPVILQRLGRILLAQGRGAEAIPVFEKALKLSQAIEEKQTKSDDRPTPVTSPFTVDGAEQQSSTLDAETS
ncbi:MAG: tetratricopeptide repeat protein [Gammaproteobacteria bacterium]|nr:tetratricopeptide repeat protein [Gammaproteobacteria bacterium]